MALGLIALGLICGCDKPCEQPSDCGAEQVCAGLEGKAKTCKRCRELALCKQQGLCSFDDGRCVARVDDDCAGSQVCSDEGRCIAKGDSCVVFRRAKGEEGCPCGCARSQAMVAELARAPEHDAMTHVRDSLATIAERQDAGYITEAMVQHRLRLHALAAQLGEVPPRLPRSPRARALHQRRLALAPATNDRLRVRAELVTFGQIVEQIDERSKLQPACYSLWLHIENVSASSVTVAGPILRGDLTLSRWFREDSAGAPFDGHISAGESVSVLAIGYLDEPLPPGHEVTAEVQLEDLTIPLRSVTRTHWDDALRAGDASLGTGD